MSFSAGVVNVLARDWMPLKYNSIAIFTNSYLLITAIARQLLEYECLEFQITNKGHFIGKMRQDVFKIQIGAIFIYAF